MIALISDERLSSSLFIWVAGLALLCSAYLNLKQGDFPFLINPWVGDPYPRIIYFSALGVCFILAWLAATRFFGKNKFEMSYWGYTFPLATMAIVTLQ